MDLIDVPDTHLLVMPLHTVTEVDGAAGLRRRLAAELRRLPSADRGTVADAAVWAAQLHAGQRRTREQYGTHLLRVALRILCHYRVTDPEVLVAALLHDAVEDQPWAMAGQSMAGQSVGGRAVAGRAPRAEAFAVLAARHGDRVARLVGAVTNPEPEAGIRYTDHLAEALDREPWARVIKFSDFTDNGVGISYAVGPKIERSARKYAPAVPVLRDLLHRPDTVLEAAVTAHIGRQFDLAEQRFAAILAG